MTGLWANLAYQSDKSTFMSKLAFPHGGIAPEESSSVLTACAHDVFRDAGSSRRNLCNGDVDPDRGEGVHLRSKRVGTKKVALRMSAVRYSRVASQLAVIQPARCEQERGTNALLPRDSREGVTLSIWEGIAPSALCPDETQCSYPGNEPGAHLPEPAALLNSTYGYGDEQGSRELLVGSSRQAGLEFLCLYKEGN